jgi:muramoyltetrapeptide carboxypeptidase
MTRPLQIGSAVGVLVASSPVGEAHRLAGLGVLAELGLLPREEPDPLAGCHYLSKDPQVRVANLVRFLRDESLGAVWLARGGYGSNLMLPELDKQSLPKVIKPVLGSSDGCYLLWYLLDRCELPVFLAPMIYASMTQPDGYDQGSLRWALFGEGPFPSPRGVSDGNFSLEGRLHGGCLSMLASLVGTPWMPSLSGTLLILEDLNERPYRLERMVWQLVTSGRLEGVTAVLFGQFPGCFKDAGEKDHFYQRMKEILGPLEIPFAWDFAIGHAPQVVTLPLGVRAVLKAGKGCGQLSLV